MPAYVIRGMGIALLVALGFFAGRLSMNPSVEGTPAPPSQPLVSMLPPLPGNASAAEVDANEADEAGSEEASPGEIPPEVLKMLSALASVMDSDQYAEAVRAWLAQDPEGAIGYLTEATKHPQEMTRWLVQMWSEIDPEKASAWLIAQSESEHRDSAIEGLTRGIANSDPESALRWVSQIDNPLIKYRAARRAGYQQFRYDPVLAEERLLKTGLPASGIEALMGNWERTWEARSRRNAQNVSSVFAAALAAGAAFEGTSAAEVIREVSIGKTVEGGAFDGEFFGVPNLTEREVDALARWLRLNASGALAYDPGGDED